MHEPAAIQAHQSLLSLRHVFVYGTLRRGEANDIHRLTPKPRFCAMGYVSGQMWDLGHYPGLRLKQCTSIVWGEVYEISPALWASLNRIEGIGDGGFGDNGQEDEYRLREVAVRVGATDIQCGVYEIHMDRIAGARLLVHGDWSMRSATPL